MNDLLKLHKTVGGNGLNKLTYREYLDEHFNLGELKGDVIVEGNKLITPINKEPFLYFKTTTTKNEGSDTSLVVTDRGMVVEETPEFKYSFKITGKQKLDISGGLITRLCSGDDYTIDFQLKTHSRLTPYSRILDADQLRLGYYNTENLWQCKYFDGTSQATRTFTPTIGEWQQITLMRKDGVNYFFVDGVLIHSIEGTVSTFTEGLFRIGYTYNYSTDNYYNGSIAHFRIFDMAIFPPTGFEPFKCDEDYAKYNGYRISPPIELPKNIVSSKIDWEGEGKISLYDPNYKAQVDSHTLLLLTGDDFNDKSSYNNEVTNKNVTIVDDPKYGACYSTTTNKSLSVLNKDDMFSFGDKDFTLDFRIKFNSFFANLGIFTPMGDTAWVSKTGSWHIIGHANKTITFDYYSNTSTVVQLSSKALVENTWYHIALVVKNKVVSLYIDGVKQGSLTLAVPLIGQSKILIAKHDGDNEINLQGYLTDFRISDVARWETDFNTDFRYVEPIGSYLELNKGETFKIPQKYLSSIHLKQEVKGEETISNVKLELKYKPKKEYIRPSDLKEEIPSKLVLYNNGDECDKVTGGWKGHQWDTSFTAGYFSKKDTYLEYGDNTSNYGYGGFVTNSGIDLTPYSTLYVDFQFVSYSASGYSAFHKICVCQDNTPTIRNQKFDYVHSVSNAPGRYQVEIDVSNYNGIYYLGVQGQSGSYNNHTNIQRLYYMELRK